MVEVKIMVAGDEVDLVFYLALDHLASCAIPLPVQHTPVQWCILIRCFILPPPHSSPMKFMRLAVFGIIICLLNIGPVIAGGADKSVNFAREILPILSNHCFVCHGPDIHDDTDLRLDSFDAASDDRGGYRAIDPENPKKSEVLARIDSKDDPMPPVDAEKQLTDAQRDLLRRWIEQGGQYASHWAFIVPTKADTFDQTSEAIDAYIGKRLKSEHLDFAPEADKSTLARRVALILTGLPLEPEELEQYLSDGDDNAYENLVDRLLDNPRFGEHQARYWLDAVRYGDTHGLHLDNRRGIYPYRDWVVRAFNNNLPYDKFIEWQLAGDLLPNPTLEQQVATGFVRLNPSTGEGGAISDEFQMKNNFDRVETLGTVFLGMSLTCARCHTHKYDPIEQTEYYKLLSFFNSTAEPALDGNSYTYGPVTKVPPDQDAWKQWNELTEFSNELISQAEAEVIDFDAVVQYAIDRAGWSAIDWKISPPIKKSAASPPESEWSDAIGLPGVLDRKLAAQRKLGNDQLAWISFDLTVPTQQSLDLTFSGAAGSHVLIDRRNVPIYERNRELDDATSVSTTSINFAPGKHTVQIAIYGDDNLPNIEVRIANRWDALAKTKDWESLSVVEQLSLIADTAGPLSGMWSNRASQAAASIVAAQSQFTTSLVAKELPEPRQTRLLRRGEYDLPIGDPLQPGTLTVLNPFPDDAPQNRLGLAKWLTAPDHPLVARVLVNRLWQQIFGVGLVRTPEEFGLQGEQPTHPELLDWLAVQFQQSGWNMKLMLRAMVTSRTFRQSSKWRSDVDDPENRLYSRASSYRLDAEVLRDIGLWASQLLNPMMGGEGVKPYQPDGMWQALAHPASNTKQYQRDSGDRLYRRSLYVYWKRTSPHPMMTLFDAPDRESSCVRRSRTNTPLQSLGMLNETQRVEMARSFAERLIRSADDDHSRITLMFRLLAHRDPRPIDVETCHKLLRNAANHYMETPADAEALLSIGEAQRDTSFDPIQHAAWAQLASVILASDVAILLY